MGRNESVAEQAVIHTLRSQSMYYLVTKIQVGLFTFDYVYSRTAQWAITHWALALLLF